MAEKPILFSGEMVRAILNGRKTQTRRVVVPQPVIKNGWAEWGWEIVGGQKSGRPRRCFWHDDTWRREQNTAPIDEYCPYGQPGDLLWVRETWSDNIRGCPNGLTYRADHLNPKGDGPAIVKWRPSIFMPRWASRITLRVCDVRVERLQGINEADAQQEGWYFQNHDLSKRYDPVTMDTARQWFGGLWDSINAKRGYGWDTNPWVWVVSFELVR